MPHRNPGLGRHRNASECSGGAAGCIAVPAQAPRFLVGDEKYSGPTTPSGVPLSGNGPLKIHNVGAGLIRRESATQGRTLAPAPGGSTACRPSRSDTGFGVRIRPSVPRPLSRKAARPVVEGDCPEPCLLPRLALQLPLISRSFGRFCSACTIAACHHPGRSSKLPASSSARGTHGAEARPALTAAGS